MNTLDRPHKIKTLVEGNLEPSTQRTDRHPMEEEDGTKEPLKQEPPSPSNSQKTISDDEELDYSAKPEFYGSDLDDKDEKWVEKKRRGTRASDAVLSCPGCFTTVCLECQRHAKYLTQYRAIFVVNCTVKNEKVQQKKKRSSSNSSKRKRNVEGSGGSEDGEELVNNVCCEVCSTVVGIMDDDQVYHFFNVLPSEA